MFKQHFTFHRSQKGSTIWAFLVVALLAVSESASFAEVKVQFQDRRLFEFKTAGVRFHSDFPGARLNDCSQVSDSHFRILIRPENTPINNSAWFAFQVVAEKPQTITVILAYEGGRHRYHPKISNDGKQWTPLGANLYRRDRDKNEAVLTLQVGPKPLWVSAQELITAPEFDAWMKKMDQAKFISRSNIGVSMLKHPIDQLEISEASATNYVFIIGRQHPPEVTGTFGLMAFTETIASDSKLAKDFRKQFRTIVIPLLNPDGVKNGHWRHNMGGVDLNRDWRKLEQPETRLVSGHILKLALAPSARSYLMLDFHSTGDDIFYTQPDSAKTFPENFTALWLGAIQKRFPDYKVEREASHRPQDGTSKVWGYVHLGAPCITYEFGDNTDRQRIKQLASGAAEEMMRLLLESRSVEAN